MQRRPHRGVILLIVLCACTSPDTPPGAGADASGSATADGAPLPPPDAGRAPDATSASDATPPLDAAPPPAKRVIPIYITATDNTAAEIDQRQQAFEDVLAGIQRWYGEVMGAGYGNATFYFEPVRVLDGHYTEAEWQFFARNGFQYPDGTSTEPGGGCSMWYGALYELEDLGLIEDHGLPAIGSGSFYYVVNGGGDNGSCGAGGVLAASEAKVLDDARVHCPTGRIEGAATDCRSAGVIAHEAGHGFGLPHASDRPTCTDGPSIMDVWWDYDKGPTLCAEGKVDLAASGYFEWHVGP